MWAVAGTAVATDVVASNIDLKTTNGDVSVSCASVVGWAGGSRASVVTDNGDASIAGCNSAQVYASSVSGDVSVSKCKTVDRLSATTTSGAVTVQAALAPLGRKGGTHTLQAESTSGAVHVDLTNFVGSYTARSTAGSVYLNGNKLTSRGSASGHWPVGGQSDVYKLTASSVSGDVYLSLAATQP